MERLHFLSLCYTGVVAFLTIVTPQEFEIWARIFMYFSAGALSLVSAYFVWKNKGKGRKSS